MLGPGEGEEGAAGEEHDDGDGGRQAGGGAPVVGHRHAEGVAGEGGHADGAEEGAAHRQAEEPVFFAVFDGEPRDETAGNHEGEGGDTRHGPGDADVFAGDECGDPGLHIVAESQRFFDQGEKAEQGGPEGEPGGFAMAEFDGDQDEADQTETKNRGDGFDAAAVTPTEGVQTQKQDTQRKQGRDAGQADDSTPHP